jgi:serine phosphatase RsbU (regulator of sigma subunit)
MFAAPKTISRLLIVDSDRANHLLLKDHFEIRKYVVDYAASPGDAIARIETNPPDIVLLNVPTSSPYHLELLRVIRAQNMDMAVVVTTSDRSEQLAIDALRAGADDYLRKPFQLSEFETQFARVVSRLAVMRQNAAVHRQLGTQLARAAQLQAELLPRGLPAMPGFELSASCVPAHGVGGDFYDWKQVSPDVLKLTVGDVMGKGMPAAMLMTATRTLLRAVAPDTAPADAVQLMAVTLEDDLARSGAFVTLFHAQLDARTSRLTYVDAGHGYAALRRANGCVELLRPRGLPLGIVTDEKYEGGSVSFDPGDVLVLYTDGLKDARPDLWPTPEALASKIESGASASEIVTRFVDEARAWAALSRDVDDITLVALRREG